MYDLYAANSFSTAELLQCLLIPKQYATAAVILWTSICHQYLM